MKRTLILLLTAAFVAGFAVSASAATSVVLSADATSYTAGATITLTVTVTSNGGETDNSVGGNVNYSDALLNAGARGIQSSLPPGDWTQGALNCTTAFCTLFSQIRAAGTTAVGLTNHVINTATFVVDLGATVGSVINITWRTTPTTQRLDWFGITNAPGISATVVPEPTTAALLGLGLFGLAVAGRRRS